MFRKAPVYSPFLRVRIPDLFLIQPAPKKPKTITQFTPGHSPPPSNLEESRAAPAVTKVPCQPVSHGDVDVVLVHEGPASVQHLRYKTGQTARHSQRMRSPGRAARPGRRTGYSGPSHDLGRSCSSATFVPCCCKGCRGRAASRHRSYRLPSCRCRHSRCSRVGLRRSVARPFLNRHRPNSLEPSRGIWDRGSSGRSCMGSRCS